MKTTRLLFALMIFVGFGMLSKSMAAEPVDTLALIKQDSINARSLIISEIMHNSPGNRSWHYMELTNTGTQTLDMSRFVAFGGTVWYVGWAMDNYENQRKIRLTGTLDPGDTYLYVQGTDNGSVDPYQNPLYPNGFCNVEAWAAADQQTLYWGDLADTVYKSSFVLARGTNTGIFYSNVIKSYQDTVFPDSVFIDRFGVDGNDISDNPGVTFTIAGVNATTPTQARIYVRKYAVKSGNTIKEPINEHPIEQWNNSRGTDISDSEWIPLPKSMNGEFDKTFTTMNYHGPQPDFELTSTLADVDIANKKLSIPYGTSRDSVFRLFETGINHAWELKLGADTGQFYVQEDDSLIFYTVGDDLLDFRFGVELKGDPTKSAQVAPLVYKQDDGTYTKRYSISNGITPMDTIGTLPYDTPVDTFYKYMVKEPGASWKIIPASGTARPEIKNGDILEVTAADGETIKQYYLGARGFFPSHNAEISTIYFPGLMHWENPNTYELTDTMLDFTVGNQFYVIELEEGTDIMPPMVATTTDHRAQIQITRAKDLKGSEEDRTASIKVIAEDDTTMKEYKILFNVKRETPKIQGSLFLSDVGYSWGGNWSANIEIYNPSDEYIDLSDYALVVIHNKGWDYMLGQNGDGTDFAKNNQWILRFGSKVMPDEAGTPVFVSDLNQQKLILDPQDVLCTSSAGAYPLSDAHKWEENRVLCDELDLVYGEANKSVTTTNKWPFQGWHQYFAEKRYGSVDPYGTGSLPLKQTQTDFGSTKDWRTVRLGLARIVNDSIKDGLKHFMNDFENDYEWVDVFGGPNYDWKNAKIYDNDTIYLFKDGGGDISFYRKPYIYTGNPVEGLSFGLGVDETKKTVKASEWYMFGKNMGNTDPAYDDTDSKTLRARRFNNHVMITYAHISYLTSSVYIMEEGLVGPQQVYGVTAGTTVDQFLANVNKADTGMVIKVLGSDGSVLSGNDALSAGSNVWSKSAAGNDSVNYVITNLGALSSDCSLTSDTYTITKDDTTGVIAGVVFGTTLEDVMAKLTGATGSTVIPTDGTNVMPLMKYNRDTIEIQKKNMTMTLAATNIYVEVIAQDKVTKCLYSIQFADEADPYVLSDVYVIDQDKKVIDFAGRTTPYKFKNNLVPSPGASIKVVNKYDQERTDGMMEYSDRLIVTKGDISVEYWVKYTVNEEIIGVDVNDVETESLSIYPNPTTDFVTIEGVSGKTIEIRDLTGKMISKRSINSENPSIDMRSMSSGVYIISTENNSYKVIKE